MTEAPPSRAAADGRNSDSGNGVYKKNCEVLVKLRSACSCSNGCSFPVRTGAIVSSPVFVGEKIARFGAAISSLKKMDVYGLLRFIR